MRDDMRRVVIRPTALKLGGIGGVGWGDARTDRDATEWRREILDAATIAAVLIGDGIAGLPNAIHAFGIVSYKWRSSLSATNGVLAAAKLNVP